MGINRNIVECKFSNHDVDFVVDFRVLIETLWNVNILPCTRPVCVELEVLIETLWNVNVVYRAGPC